MKEVETTERASLSIPISTTSIEALPHPPHDVTMDGEPDASPVADAAAGNNSTTASHEEKIVWTDPRPPIPTLMRALDHVSSCATTHIPPITSDDFLFPIDLVHYDLIT